MKILLVNLPWRSFLKTGVRAGSRWPHLKGSTEKDYLPFPFFLAHSASLLKKNGVDVTLIDAIAEDMFYGQFLNVVRNINPDLLVCETSTVTLDHDMRLLSKIGSDIPVALCGPDVNMRQPSFLEAYDFVDYVLVGEYEFTLLDLTRHLKTGRRLDGVSGLIYRSPQGVKVNFPRPLSALDELPWPLRQLTHIHRYNDAPGDLPTPSAQMLASRGCPYKCKFCLWPQVMYQSNQYRVRNVTDVVNEMEYLVKELNYKSIYFDDDTFNIGKERMLKLCSEIKERRLNIPWAIMARADLMDKEMLEKMRGAGLYAVKYGIESATQGLLDGIDKNADIKKAEEVVRLTKKLGIKTHLTFTFGLPGETKESMQKTLDFSLNLDPATIQFSIATPFPGTQFYKEMKERGHIVSEKWSEYDGNHKSVMTLTNLTKKDIECAIRTAYKRWAEHCAKRRRSKKIDFYQLLKNSFKKYGFFVTLLKIVIFLRRYLFPYIKEKIFYKKEIRGDVKENGLKIGRLALVFDRGSLGLYWDGMRLTKGEGFASSFRTKDKILKRKGSCGWDFKRLNNTEILLTRALPDSDLEEAWKVKVVDEKQIDWDLEVRLKNGTRELVSHVMLMLSAKYSTWIDSWGEGGFYPVNDYRNVDLRNPNTDFIGLRGRKRLKGQLPTILLDLSRNSSDVSPTIKNANKIMGARTLGAQVRFSNGIDGHSSDTHRLFSGRIKIVEEDFNKRKLSKKK